MATGLLWRNDGLIYSCVELIYMQCSLEFLYVMHIWLVAATIMALSMRCRLQMPNKHVYM